MQCRRGKKKILTWGGPWSNHIVATAFACHHLGLSCVLLIRGERPENLSATLSKVIELGAETVFIPPSVYGEKMIPSFPDRDEIYCIPEGGRTELGVSGASDIADLFEIGNYTHLACAGGTGTMAAGLLRRLEKQQELLVVSVLKGYTEMENDISGLAGAHTAGLHVTHDFHFGGYARASQVLFDHMNKWYRQWKIPTDFVYTGKLFYAMEQLHSRGKFPRGSRVMLIHSGGLQGNASLEKGTLIF